MVLPNPNHEPSDDVLARALRLFPESSLVTNADQEIIFANEAFVTATGYPLRELIGRNCRLLQGPATHPPTVHALRHALEKGERFEDGS